MSVVGAICLFRVGPGYDGWHGVCDPGVLSAVEARVDHGGVNVFHVCLNFGVLLFTHSHGPC